MQVDAQEIKRPPGSSFVGRQGELSELRAGIDRAIAGRGGLATIAGEPGIGKSRLADQAGDHASANGARVLWGRCWEGGGAPAYWPWIQVIRDLAGGSDQRPLQWMGAGTAEIVQIVPELHKLFPELQERAGSALTDPEQARFRLFDSVVGFLRRAAEAQPLVIVLDDLHAADPTSLM